MPDETQASPESVVKKEALDVLMSYVDVLKKKKAYSNYRKGESEGHDMSRGEMEELRNQGRPMDLPEVPVD